MHIDEKILVIDGDLNQISLFQIEQALILSHIHRNETRLPFTCIDSGLVTSHFLDGPEKYPVPGHMLCITLVSRGSGISHGTDGYYQR
jgi:hypothetical protein